MENRIMNVFSIIIGLAIGFAIPIPEMNKHEHEWELLKTQEYTTGYCDKEKSHGTIMGYGCLKCEKVKVLSQHKDLEKMEDVVEMEVIIKLQELTDGTE